MSTPVAITGIARVTTPSCDALRETVRARAARAERITQLALAATGNALGQAGLLATDGDLRLRMGVVFGSAFGCLLTNAAFQRRFAAGGPSAASPRLFAATVSNAAAGEVGIAYRLGGPAITLTAGRVAGLVAVGHATDLVRAGQADVLVAGGVDAAGEALDRWMADAGMPAPTRSADEAIILVLEQPGHALARGARIIGHIVGQAAGFGRADVAAIARADAGDQRVGPERVLDTLATLPAALADDAAAVLTIAGHCPSGHVASLVVRRAA